MNIIVLCGGLSAERDVSLVSGRMIAQALRRLGHRAVLVDLFFGYTYPYDDPKDIFGMEYHDELGGITADVPDLDALRRKRGDNSPSRIGKNIPEICAAADIDLYHPLWQESREALVKECIREGFIAHITTLDTARLSEKHLGKVLSEEEIKEIAAEGADACGENGEYHTFVSDGPLFRRPVDFAFGEPIRNGSYAALPLTENADPPKGKK